METVGMDLRGICDLEHALEPDALLANIAQKVFLGGAAHITQCSDVLLTEAHLYRAFAASEAEGASLQARCKHIQDTSAPLFELTRLQNVAQHMSTESKR